jgi:transposase
MEGMIMIDPSIKEQAIMLVEEHGIKVPQVSRELGVGRSTLEKWLKEHRASTSSRDLSLDDRAELKRLREQNRQLTVEKELLKKATVYFAKHSE